MNETKLFEIKSRFTGEVLFSLETESLKLCVEAAVKRGVSLSYSNLRGSDLSYSDLSYSDLSYSNLRGSDLRYSDLSYSNLSYSNLRGSDLRDSDLSYSDLSGSNLSGSDLSCSDLSYSNLSGSNLSGSDLRCSNLRGSDLRGSDPRGSDLRGSDLRGSDLRGSDLDPVKWDFFGRLSVWPNEADALLLAIQEGRVDGSTYRGECACFVGTIANAKETSYTNLNGLTPDSDSPTERLFMGIREGDTPETNPVSKIVEDWVIQFIRYRDAARGES